MKTVRQSIKYLLQVMIDLFEFSAEGQTKDPAYYSKVGYYVRDVMGYKSL